MKRNGLFICQKKGIFSTFELANLSKLYVNSDLQTLLNNILSSRKSKSTKSKYVKLCCCSYIDITLQLCSIRHTMGEQEPWISWYSYVAYLVSGFGNTDMFGLQGSTLNLHMVMCVINYAVNDEKILIDTTMNDVFTPSPIKWIKCITSLNEFRPTITTLPNRLIKRCEEVIAGGVRLYKKFNSVANNIQKNNLNLNEERKLANSYTKQENSVIKEENISIKNLSYMKLMCNTHFYNISRFHFNNLSLNSCIPFREDEDTVNRLKENFAGKLNEADNEFNKHMTKYNTVTRSYSEVFGRKKHRYIPYINRHKEKSRKN